jgi:hypothetical protein
LAVGFLIVAGVQAAGTPDRIYLFGDDNDIGGVDDAVETPTAGGTPSANIPGIGVVSLTVDSKTTATNFSDEQSLGYSGTGGGPVYTNVGPSGLARPGALAGTFGLDFDGTDVVNSNLAAPPVGGSGGGLGAPLVGDNAYSGTGAPNYTGTAGVPSVLERYLEGWVRPTGGAGTRRDIVNDTSQVQVFINNLNNWAYVWGSNADGTTPTTTVTTTTPAALNQWTHIMHRSFTDTAAVLYVNGIAVPGGLTEGNYNGGLVTTGAAADITFGASFNKTTNFFTGQLDNFVIGVAGNTTGVVGGKNWGVIDLRVDNDFIRQELVGKDLADVNLNGVVNQEDVDIFLANWRKTFPVIAGGRAVGDLNSRKLGDLNIDGVVNLQDAFILHANFAAGSGGGSFELSMLGVPEPASAVLMVCGLTVLGWRRRRRNGF